MACKQPYMQGNYAFDCGACLPCKLKKRREWTLRIMLEASQSVDNAFITLTYSDETLPPSGSLTKKHLQDFLKRLRTEIAPARVRYYAVGEYGETTHRPHYHVAMFGYPNCLRGRSRFGLMTSLVTTDSKCCEHCDRIARTWQKGGIYVGALEMSSAQYVAGYVVKKMTHSKDTRLNGREPEFGLMSRRPGVGVMAMHDVANELLKFNLEQSITDVPSVLQIGKKKLPIARHLRVKLREMIGRDGKAPPQVHKKLQEEMLLLLQDSLADAEVRSLKKMIVLRDQGKVASLESKFAIQNSRGKKL